MLEIFILFKLGQAINRKATSKGWPGWPFVIIMVGMYVCLGFGCGILAVVLTADPNAAGDDGLIQFVLGYAIGAVLAAISSYFLVVILPDRSEPEDDYNRPRGLRDRDDDDEEELPRARRERDEDDEDRDVPRARRDYDDDWRRR